MTHRIHDNHSPARRVPRLERSPSRRQYGVHSSCVTTGRAARAAHGYPAAPTSRRATRQDSGRSSIRLAGTVSYRLHELDMEILLRPRVSESSDLREYTALQAEAYGHHGVLVAKRTSDACMRSCSHLVLARHPDGTLAGGLRIHEQRLGLLPIEAALPGYPRLWRLIERLGESVELSGTVVRADLRKTGLTSLLVGAAVAAIPLLQIRSALGFGHQHVLPMYRAFGFVPRDELGCHAYPDPRYRSRVAVLADAWGLTGVDAAARALILDLRQRLGHGMREVEPDLGSLATRGAVP